MDVPLEILKGNFSILEFPPVGTRPPVENPATVPCITALFKAGTPIFSISILASKKFPSAESEITPEPLMIAIGYLHFGPSNQAAKLYLVPLAIGVAA